MSEGVRDETPYEVIKENALELLNKPSQADTIDKPEEVLPEEIIQSIVHGFLFSDEMMSGETELQVAANEEISQMKVQSEAVIEENLVDPTPIEGTDLPIALNTVIDTEVSMEMGNSHLEGLSEEEENLQSEIEFQETSKELLQANNNQEKQVT